MPATPPRKPRLPAPAREPLPAPPALVTAAIAAFVFAGILLLVTTPIDDPDLWQHLLVGKVILATHAVPSTQVWTWPMYGQPDVLPSWLFRVIVWPLYHAWGFLGLQAWRWLGALAVFAFAWQGARSAGARGPFALLAIFSCALLYRYRSQVRPDGMVAILMAAQMALLESRRSRPDDARGIDPAWGLVPLALVWVNVHMSYWIGWALTTFYLADTFVPGRGGFVVRSRRTLVLVLAACVGVSFLNPAGWRQLEQPFEYFFVWRHEALYRIVGELRPVVWAAYNQSLLPLWLAAVPLLAIARWRRSGFDLVELLVIGVFIPQALSTQRFLIWAAVLVAPFFARDLDAWVRGLAWPRPLAAPWAQAGLVAVLCTASWLPSARDPGLKAGWGMPMEHTAVGACDWLATHDVRGRGFNPFEMGGYVLYRFFPDRARLPFMDIHLTGTHEDHMLAAYALAFKPYWERLDRKYRFDWALLHREDMPGQTILDSFDADSATWGLVFRDDAAAVYVRRDGAMADVAARERFRDLPGGPVALAASMSRAVADTAARARLRAELVTSSSRSKWNADDLTALGFLDLVDGRAADARRAFTRAGEVKPDERSLHANLGTAWLMDGNPGEALREFRAEARSERPSPLVDLRLGQALDRLGRRDEARRAFLRAQGSAAARAEATDSLAALGAR